MSSTTDTVIPMSERSTNAPITTTTPDHGGFLDFIKDNIWIPILIGVVAVVIIVLIVILMIRRRRSRRFDYIALPTEVDMPLRLEIDRKKLKDEERDTALLNCSFYLRSTGRYTLIDHLPEIGSRLEKHWFLTKDKGAKGEKLLNMLKKGSNMPINFNKASKKVLSEFFIIIQHPYVYPVDDVDFVLEQDLIMFLHSYNSKGSLKDLIYNSHCCEGWHGKYCFRGKALAVPQVQIYGRQILEGLLYLEDKGVSPFGHLHSGNVILQNQTCRITGYENTVLGLSSKLEPLLRKKLKTNKDAMDVLSFGHLLFEMATGYELDTPAPEPKHLVNISHQPTIEILYFIFENPSGRYPSVKDIAQHGYFKHIVLRELQMFNPQPIQMTTGVKSLIKVLRKNRSKSRKKSTVSKDETMVEMRTQPNHTSSPRPSKEERRKSKSSKRRRSVNNGSLTEPFGPVPTPPPLPGNQAVTVEIPQPSNARNALLDDIRGGTAKLKKTTDNVFC